MPEMDIVIAELQAIRAGQQAIMDKVTAIDRRLAVVEAREQPAATCREFFDRESVPRDELSSLHQELHDTQVVRAAHRLNLFNAAMLLFGGSGVGVLLSKLLT